MEKTIPKWKAFSKCALVYAKFSGRGNAITLIMIIEKRPRVNNFGSNLINKGFCFLFEAHLVEIEFAFTFEYEVDWMDAWSHLEFGLSEFHSFFDFHFADDTFFVKDFD